MGLDRARRDSAPQADQTHVRRTLPRRPEELPVPLRGDPPAYMRLEAPKRRTRGAPAPSTGRQCRHKGTRSGLPEYDVSQQNQTTDLETREVHRASWWPGQTRACAPESVALFRQCQDALAKLCVSSPPCSCRSPSHTSARRASPPSEQPTISRRGSSSRQLVTSLNCAPLP